MALRPLLTFIQIRYGTTTTCIANRRQASHVCVDEPYRPGVSDCAETRSAFAYLRPHWRSRDRQRGQSLVALCSFLPPVRSDPSSTAIARQTWAWPGPSGFKSFFASPGSAHDVSCLDHTSPAHAYLDLLCVQTKLVCFSLLFYGI